MNNLEKDVLNNGLTIFTPESKETPYKPGLTLTERILLMQALLKKRGMRLFTQDEAEQLFKLSRRTIRKTIEGLVNNGHLS